MVSWKDAQLERDSGKTSGRGTVRRAFDFLRHLERKGKKIKQVGIRCSTLEEGSVGWGGYYTSYDSIRSMQSHHGKRFQALNLGGPIVS